MMENVPDGDPQPQESRPGDAVLVDAVRVCLRCDWTGETDSKTCPRCEAPLYRLPGSRKPVEATPTPRPQPRPADAPTPGAPVRAPREDDRIEPVAPAAVGRRRWVIVGAVAVVAAVWIVATGGPFDRRQAPNEPPTASATDEPTTADGRLRRGDEVLMVEGSDLVAVDPDTAKSRTLLDLGAGTDPLPTAADGEVIRGEITNAAWSPNGRWVAFDGPRGALWVMNAGMEVRRLASSMHGGWVWAPTGGRLAMIMDTSLIVVDASTGQQTDLGEVVGDVTSPPVWFPDGTRILFGARGGSLHSVDVRSGERSLFVRLPGDNLDSMDEIEWSPDGAYLLVMNDLEPGGGRLYVMNPDGSGVRVLLDDYEPGGLAWSPDGESIAYVRYEEGGGEGTRLWTIAPGGGVALAVAAGTDIRDPAWSPNGSRIAFVGSTTEGDHWYEVDADGASPRSEIDELTYLSWRGGAVSRSF